MVEDICAVSRLRNKIQGGPVGVLLEPNVRFFNFHTLGEVVSHDSQGNERNYPLDRILIDGGAVVNLMPEEVARRLGVKLEDNSDILIRTATNEVRNVRYCTRFHIRIAGVTAEITVHVLDIPQSYSLLLGRRWLYQVRALGDYADHSYVIYDMEGKPHQMTSTLKAPTHLHPSLHGPEILVNTDGGPGLTDQEKEELRGQKNIHALMAKVAIVSREQARKYEEDYGDDEEEESEDEDSGEEDTTRQTQVSDPPKGRRQ